MCGWFYSIKSVCYFVLKSEGMYGLFSRERKVYFQQDCKEGNDEIVKQKY